MQRTIVESAELLIRVFDDHFTPAGRTAFAEQVREALESPDREAVPRVLESWHRSLLIRHNPNFPNLMERAASAEPVTLEELRAELGL